MSNSKRRGTEELDKYSAHPILPLHNQQAPNESIDLGGFDASFVIDGKTHLLPVKVEMIFSKNPDLRFIIRDTDAMQEIGFSILLEPKSWNGKLLLVDNDIVIEGFCTSVGGKHGGIVIAPTTSAVVTTKPTSSISHAVFHLFNFPNFRDAKNGYVLRTGNPSQQGAILCGRTTLRYDGWVITIAETDEMDSKAKALKSEGGHIITHLGRIERADGSSFSDVDLQSILSNTHLFLSFAIGRWAGLALIVGFDSEDNKVFEELGTRRSSPDSWSGSHSWFDSQNGELLSEVFPGFCRWSNSLAWRDRAGEVISWYIAANDRGHSITVDMSIILAQAALELLAWTHCIQERNVVSERAFKRGGLVASDKLRLLASIAEVPTQIPDQLDALQDYNDVPEAITEIRNAVVHPDKKSQPPKGAWYAGWRLAMWHLDLILLSLCEHNGNYANRLAKRWTGTVESVPWSKRESE